MSAGAPPPNPNTNTSDNEMTIEIKSKQIGMAAPIPGGSGGGDLFAPPPPMPIDLTGDGSCLNNDGDGDDQQTAAMNDPGSPPPGTSADADNPNEGQNTSSSSSTSTSPGEQKGIKRKLDEDAAAAQDAASENVNSSAAGTTQPKIYLLASGRTLTSPSTQQKAEMLQRYTNWRNTPVLTQSAAIVGHPPIPPHNNNTQPSAASGTSKTSISSNDVDKIRKIVTCFQTKKQPNSNGLPLPQPPATTTAKPAVTASTSTSAPPTSSSSTATEPPSADKNEKIKNIVTWLHQSPHVPIPPQAKTVSPQQQAKPVTFTQNPPAPPANSSSTAVGRPTAAQLAQQQQNAILLAHATATKLAMLNVQTNVAKHAAHFLQQAGVGVGGSSSRFNIGPNPNPLNLIQQQKSIGTVTNTYKTYGTLPASANLTPTLPPDHKPLPPPPVEAFSPMPPNWDAHLDEAIMHNQCHKTFPVDSTSQEFQQIAELMAPYQVTSVEQCVNPDLWQRYTNTRKELLRSKSEDLELLSKLGFDSRELQRRSHQIKNYNRDPLLSSQSAKYSPNEVLLFHCTRDPANLEKILNQGLDERLSASKGGILGKGIYFADDPIKSAAYDGTRSTILIFAVLLGDCLSVHDFSKIKDFVREPEKTELQKRSTTDQFFDSITASLRGYNEYVIYNRYQCCPLYKIKYKNQPGPVPVGKVKHYHVARRRMPVMAWNPMPNQALDGSWPFFAGSLLEKMRIQGSSSADPITVPDLNNSTAGSRTDADRDAQIVPVPQAPPPVPQAMVHVPFPRAGPPPPVMAPQLQLSTPTASSISNHHRELIMADVKKKVIKIVNILGITDTSRIKNALVKCKLDLDITMNYLQDNRDQQQQGQGQGSSSSISNNSSITPSTSTSTSTSTAIIGGTQAAAASGSGSAISSSMDTSSKDSPVKGVIIPIVDLSLEDNDKAKVKPPTPSLVKELCPICCEEYEPFDHSPQFWKELECSHQLCLKCYQKIETKGTTMSRKEFTSVKCPFCQHITGILVGTCPNGTMTVGYTPQRCSGYPGSSYQIEYQLRSYTDPRHNLTRIAYLPTTVLGTEVLRLLKVAFDRRLIFVIGTSNTTGAQNVPVWNIHHKTSLTGGVGAHGYPDCGYLDRVLEELKSFGIE